MVKPLTSAFHVNPSNQGPLSGFEVEASAVRSKQWENRPKSQAACQLDDQQLQQQPQENLKPWGKHSFTAAVARGQQMQTSVSKRKTAP